MASRAARVRRWPFRGATRLALLPLAVGCGPALDPRPSSVILLVLDGVRTDEFTTTYPSDVTGVPGETYASATWDALAPEGTVLRAAVNPGVTITAPAHASLLTGREEVFANFPLDRAVGPGLYRPEHPTVFEEARAQLGLGSDEVAFVANTELLMGVRESIAPGYDGGAQYALVIDPIVGSAANDDTPVVEILSAMLEAPPRLLVANLHDADRAGHYGEGDAYADDVAKIDGLVADFWTRLSDDHPELKENLLLIVTADHGRHRHDRHDGWHNHGDACTGCREVPLFFVGRARAGEEADDRVVTTDLAPTIAAHLGIDLPWATGLPYDAALEAADAGARSGEVGVAVSGARRAAQVWRDDRDARSEVRVDDTIVSTPGVYAAEAPALLDATGGARVCFRELDLDTGADELPWTPRCLAEGEGGWADMGFPDTIVGPFWQPALVERQGTTWVAWAYNPNAAADEGAEGDIGLHLAGWTAEGGWSERVWTPALFPTDVVLTTTGSGLVAAFGTNLGPPDYRYTRRVRVVPVSVGDAAETEAAVDFDFAALLGEGGRVEHPALHADHDRVWLAALGHRSEGDGVASLVVAVQSHDGGRTWGEPVALPDAGTPFPHLAPAWDGAVAVWAVAPAERDGEALLCRAAPGDAEAECVGVGSPRVDSFALEDGGAVVSIDAGVGAWETVVVAW